VEGEDLTLLCLACDALCRAIQPEDCVPFKFRKRPAAAAAPQGMDVVGAGGLLDEEPGLAATLLHSLMRAIA
jgi:hypothetical protein